MGGRPQATRRVRRYTAVSVLNLVLGQGVLAFAFGVLGWSAVAANLLAAGVATVPTYLMYRHWVWDRSGRSHVRRELLPFLAIVLIGVVVVTGAAALGEAVAGRVTDARPLQTAIVVASTLVACGALWVARFLFLDRFIFGRGRHG